MLTTKAREWLAPNRQTPPCANQQSPPLDSPKPTIRKNQANTKSPKQIPTQPPPQPRRPATCRIKLTTQCSRVSLANKCLLLFGTAVVVIIVAALTIPWFRMNAIVEEQQHEASRLLADAWLANQSQPILQLPAPITSTTTTTSPSEPSEQTDPNTDPESSNTNTDTDTNNNAHGSRSVGSDVQPDPTNSTPRSTKTSKTRT